MLLRGRLCQSSHPENGGKKMGEMSARENMTAMVERLQLNLGVCLYRHAHACAYVCVHVCVSSTIKNRWVLHEHIDSKYN